MRDGWVETTLGEFSALQMGRTPSRRENSYWTDDLTYPFCTIADMDAKYVEPKREGVTKAAIMDGKAKMATKGTLLMSFKLTIGRMGFAARDIFPNEAIVMIEADESKVLNEFLYLRLASMDLTEGSGRAVKGSTLNSASIASIAFLVPPLPEQKRIVDLISSVDLYIEALHQQLETAKRSRNAVLHELLTAGGDDWVETTLGEVAEVIGGGTPSTTIAEYWEGDIVWLTPTEITSRDGKVVSDSIRKITDLGFKNSGAQMLPKDSVILTSRASVGFVALAGKELCTNQGFQSLIPKPSVLSKFLMFWIQLNRPEFESRSAGSTFKEISKSNVKSIILELPPLAEQKRIVEIVNTIDEVISQTELTSSKAQKLRSGLLSDLLSGEHEIPVSYDEVMGAP